MIQHKSQNKTGTKCLLPRSTIFEMQISYWRVDSVFPGKTESCSKPVNDWVFIRGCRAEGWLFAGAEDKGPTRLQESIVWDLWSNLVPRRTSAEWANRLSPFIDDCFYLWPIKLSVKSIQGWQPLAWPKASSSRMMILIAGMTIKMISMLKWMW